MQWSMAFSLLTISLCFFLVEANTRLDLFSDPNCQDQNPDSVTGQDNGTCASISLPFQSFRLGQISPGYGVTVYSSDNIYCGNGYKLALQYGQCYNDTSINQFTIDASNPGEVLPSGSSSTSQATTTFITSSATSSPASSATSTESSSLTTTSNSAVATPTSHSNGSELNTNSVIGLAVGLPLFAIITLAGMFFCFSRQGNKSSTNSAGHKFGPSTVSGHGLAIFGDVYHSGASFIRRTTSR